MAFHIGSAIYWLLILALLYFTPRIARGSYTSWRALTVYDHQECNCPPNQPVTRRTHYTFLEKTLYLVSIAFMLTDHRTLRQTFPPFALARDAVPTFVVALMIQKASVPIFQLLSRKETVATRTVETLWPTFSALDSKGVSSTLATITGIVISMGVVAATKRWITHAAPMYLVGIFAALYIIIRKHNSPSWTSGYDFRCHVINYSVMAGSLLASGLFSASFMFVFDLADKHTDLYEKMDKFLIEDLFFSPLEPAGSPLNFDYIYSQFLAVFDVFALVLISYMPILVVCLAYSYDAEYTKHGLLTEDEALEIIRQQEKHHPRDRLGRVPIELSSAALPQSMISSADLPSYNAAYRTLVLFQLVGIAIYATIDWPGAPVYPDPANDFIDNAASLVFFWIWSLLAYPLICAVMILSVSSRSDRSFSSLWMYKEDWRMYRVPAASEWRGWTIIEKAETIEVSAETKLLTNGQGSIDTQKAT